VVIAGGGPTGLMLAAELALARIDVAIIERRATQDVDGSRAGGLHSRTLEVLDQRGVAERFVSQGQKHPAAHMSIPLDVGDQPTRFNYVLGLWQKHTERILADWVRELDVPIYREREVTGFSQDDSGVDVETVDGAPLRAEYLVGCDGGRSPVRKASGIDFPGWDASTSWLIAEVQTREAPALGFRTDALGIHAIGKSEDGHARIVLTEREPRAESTRTLSDLTEQLVAVYGTDFGTHSPNWISSFTDMARQAAAYRQRRVLLAGDAAHVHAPLGGQGLNLGVQDAVNLGWKLAQVVKRSSPESLLDSYHAERHPVGARVLKNTMAHVGLRRTDDRSKALNDIVSELLKLDEPRKKMAAEITGLAVRYALSDGHPLLGRRMPDLDLVTDQGTTRVFDLLREAKPVLLDFQRGDFDIGPWSDRVQSVKALVAGEWEVPAIGKVSAPAAVLVRPDGHVAWTGDGTQRGLEEALTTWFGSPAVT
jgi:3-(3-hydroxy-phenyl)propionate hydroxylase